MQMEIQSGFLLSCHPEMVSTDEVLQKEAMSQISTTDTVYFPLGTRVEKMTAMIF